MSVPGIRGLQRHLDHHAPAVSAGPGKLGELRGKLRDAIESKG